MSRAMTVALAALAVSMLFIYLQIWGVVSWQVGCFVYDLGRRKRHG